MNDLHYALQAHRLISIDDAERGLSGAVCPACHNKLRARVDGDLKRFTHIGKECEYGYDVSVVLLFLNVLNAINRIYIPYGNEYRLLRTSFSKSEYLIDNNIPVIHTSALNRDIFIYIRSGHSLTARNLYDLKRKNVSLLGIDVSGMKSINEAVAEDILLHGACNKRWIYNRVSKSFDKSYFGAFL